MPNLDIAILGAGSWGFAIANVCASNGHRVRLWEFDKEAAESLQRTRMRESVLKAAILNDTIHVTNCLTDAVKSANIIFLITPSHVTRNVLKELAKNEIDSNTIVVSCVKGIENDSLMRISEIFREELPAHPVEKFAVLSGPSHAEEVSRNIPTAVVVASTDEKNALQIQEAVNTPTFRIYTSVDVAGVELGGALKNVIAIAAGICDGAGFGDNTKAALQPRGLAEIIRLGRKFDADPHTFSGLSGMGDLIVTCMSRHSRNRHVGEKIGSGLSLDDVLGNMTMVAEGVKTCRSTVELAKKLDVEMPICFEVYNVLFANKEPRMALQDLMTRDVKPEVWF